MGVFLSHKLEENDYTMNDLCSGNSGTVCTVCELNELIPLDFTLCSRFQKKRKEVTAA